MSHSTLLDIRTSFCSLIRRQSIQMIWMMHGPAVRQATEYLATPKAGLARWLHRNVALNSALALLRTRQINDYVAIQLCGYLDT